MRDVSRRDFLKYGAAAVAGASMLDFDAARAFGALAKPAPAIPIKDLVTKAQAEGGQCLGYFGSADIAAAMANGFHQAYPWATMNSVVSSTGTILSKVLTEVTAKQGCD